MSINNKMHVQWSCRRGMRELDLIIMPFFDACYDRLTIEQKTTFVTLLTFDDPVLLSWLMNQSIPQDVNLAELIIEIQKFNAENLLC